jgi:hypothetical protein
MANALETVDTPPNFLWKLCLFRIKDVDSFFSRNNTLNGKRPEIVIMIMVKHFRVSR